MEHLYLPVIDVVGKCYKNCKSFSVEKHSAFSILQLNFNMQKHF